MSAIRKFLPFVVLIGAYLLFQNWALIGLHLNPIDSSEIGDDDVVMYSTSWCSYCAKARNFMRRANIPFVEYDVEKSASAMREYERISGRGVPVLRIGDQILEGFDPQAMREAIERLQAARKVQTEKT